jgi:D-alanyl-D-alanine carboxypeptidase
VYVRRRVGAAIVAVALLVGGVAAATQLGDDAPSTVDTIAPIDTLPGDVVTSPTDLAVSPSDPPPPPLAGGTESPVTDAAGTSIASVGTQDGPPSVDATAYAVYDTSTGEWLAESGADNQVAIGSVMKLLTAKVVIDEGDLTRVVTVPDLQMDPMESAIGLYEGEQLPRDVLLRAMLIVSANDAARALAVDVGGSQDAFVEMMNQTAQALGLDSTVASNPVGLDSSTARSSARDMVRLAELLMQDESFRTTVARTSANLHGQTFPSTNDLLLAGYPGADGVKTGHTTDAGYCLVGSATRDGRRIIVGVFGSSTDAARLAASSALLDWAFSRA